MYVENRTLGWNVPQPVLLNQLDMVMVRDLTRLVRRMLCGARIVVLSVLVIREGVL